MKKRIVFITGCRPNFIKAYPVWSQLKECADLFLIHTGQHYDQLMSDVFFKELNMEPDLFFSLENRSRAGVLDQKLYVDNQSYLEDLDQVVQDLIRGQDLGQLGEIRDKLIDYFKANYTDLIIVFGDVTSTLAASLVAKRLGIKLCHIESGLRSGDISMPEEVNRILTDYLSDYCFVTEPSGLNNLGSKPNTYLVGNTMIDTLFEFMDRIRDVQYYEKLGLKSGEYILATLHRPSNVDNLSKLEEIVKQLNLLAEKTPVVIPIHPRTRSRIEKFNPKFTIIDPLGYIEFASLELNALYVITDSGGVQEETTAMNIKCYTLRPNTERPITLIENGGTNELIHNLDQIEFVANSVQSINYWKGDASVKIKDQLIELLQ